MKRQFFMLLTVVATIFATISCEKKENPGGGTDVPAPGNSVIELDATDKSMWHYFTVDGTKVGSANDTEMATWDDRNDWDFAIQRYVLRTKVGIYSFATETDFASIKEVPAAAEFITDAYRNVGMPSKYIKVSHAVVAKMMSGMPPSWAPAAPYAVLSADKQKAAKVNFLSYQKVVEVDGSPQTVSGHVSFNIEIIPLLDFKIVEGVDEPENTNGGH